MAQREELIFSVKLDQSEAKKRAAELEVSLKKLAQERRDLTKAYSAGLVSEERYGEELNRLNRDTTAQRKDLRQLNREIESGTTSLNAQRAELARLTRQYDAFEVGINGTQQELGELGQSVRQLSENIAEQEEATNRFQRNVGNYAGGIRQVFTGIIEDSDSVGDALKNVGDIAGSINKKLILLFAVQKIFEAGDALAQYVGELQEVRRTVSQLTGATGAALDQATASAGAIAQTFNKDVGEIITAANSASKQFGISFQESLELIGKGFSAGADSSGEFLATVQEYPANLKEVGLSAKEAFAIISQQPKTGVYSDQGIATIEEAGLRLREMPKATEEALKGIGLSSKAITNSLENGTSSVFDVIQDVSGKLGELPPQSRVVGTAIADIFGGPGEKAGLQYIKTLGNISTDLDDVIAGAGEFADRQERLRVATTKINNVFAGLAGTTGDFFEEVQVAAKEFIADGLERMVSGAVDVANWFIRMYNESIVFRGGLELVGAVAKTSFDTIQLGASSLIQSFTAVGKVLEAVFTGNFRSIPGLLKAEFNEVVDTYSQFGKDTAENFTSAFKATFDPQKKELLSLESGGSSGNAIESSTTTGEKVGLAFGDAVVKKFRATAAVMIEVLNEQEQFIKQALALFDEAQTTNDKRRADGVVNLAGIITANNKKIAESHEQLKKLDEEELARKQALQDIAEIGTQAALQNSDTIIQAFGEESKAGKAALAIKKVLAVADVTLSLQKQFAYINEAAAQIAAFIPPPFGAIAATAYKILQKGLAVGAGVAQIATIRGLAGGGFTSNKGIPDPKLPGRTISGYVHDNEYVVPTHVMRNPAGADMVRRLESMRLSGFADGGFVTRSITGPVNQQTTSVQNITQGVMDNLPPIYVSVTDINRVQGATAQVRDRANV